MTGGRPTDLSVLYHNCEKRIKVPTSPLTLGATARFYAESSQPSTVAVLPEPLFHLVPDSEYNP
jgi:hypothetical protein